jgi:glyoxylase I family protein
MSINVVGFHHFSLMTRDIERAAAFYEGVLGLERKERPNFASRGLWYAVGKDELHLIESTNVPPFHEGHPAIEVADIRQAVAVCRERGVTVREDVFVRTHDNSLSAFILDPDENMLELTQHNETHSVVSL